MAVAYLILILMAVMTAFGARIAERSFRDRPYLVGGFFGLLAVIANSCSVLSYPDCDIALSLRDAPVVVAALFFGPTSGIVAGTIAAVERALTPLFGIGAATWCPLATFLVALAAASVNRWFFDGKRPYLAQAVMLGVLFEEMHLAFDVLMGLENLSRSCELVFASFFPEGIGLMLALFLSGLAVRAIGNPRIIWRSSASRLLIAFFGCSALVVIIVSTWAEYDSHRMAEGSVRRLEHLFESQIDGLLHADASWLSMKLSDPASRTLEGFSRFLDDCDYDEINVIGPDGKVRYSNRPEVVGFDFCAHTRTRKYLKLLDGTSEYICEPFRNSIDPTHPDREVKYAAVPLKGFGFIQMGFYRERFKSEFKRFFFPLFSGVMNFLATDYNIIASTNDWRVALANGGHEASVGSLVQAVGIRPGHLHARLFGEWCHIGEKRIGEWCIFCVVPLVETYGQAIVISAIIILMLFGLIFGFRLVNLRMRRQQRKIDRLREAIDEKRRQDLETAAKIQQSCLPTELPSESRFGMLARMCPAKEVGGDFYDSYLYRDGRIVFTVADVSGKGVPAAMFMIKAKSILKSSMRRKDDIAAAIAEANQRLERNNEAQMFVTVWSGVYDPATGVVEFVNAGHNPPLVKHADGSVEWVRKRCGMALGMFPDGVYRIERLNLAPGDTLILYTDGVTEAQNVTGGFYGEARLSKLLTAAKGGFVSAVFEDVDAFAGDAEQADDITIMVLERKS